MISIGYTRAADEIDRRRDERDLAATGCHCVRVEEETNSAAMSQPMLVATLDFLKDGDELVVPRLTALSRSCADVLDIVGLLRRKGAKLRVLDPPLVADQDNGGLLVNVLTAAMQLEPGRRSRLARPARKAGRAEELKALIDQGFGPTSIAAELGISRMTVYRRLRASPELGKAKASGA